MARPRIPARPISPLYRRRLRELPITPRHEPEVLTAPARRAAEASAAIARTEHRRDSALVVMCWLAGVLLAIVAARGLP